MKSCKCLFGTDGAIQMIMTRPSPGTDGYLEADAATEISASSSNVHSGLWKLTLINGSDHQGEIPRILVGA
jgi:hypothetical protein